MKLFDVIRRHGGTFVGSGEEKEEIMEADYFAVYEGRLMFYRRANGNDEAIGSYATGMWIKVKEKMGKSDG